MTRPTEEQILEAGEELACAASSLLKIVPHPADKDGSESRVAMQQAEDDLTAAVKKWHQIYEASV